MFAKLMDRTRHVAKTPAQIREEIREEVRARHDSVGHGAAQRFSRGNVNIKRGEFLTREDIDKRLNKKRA